ncbi:MAG: ABC transporter permease [Planctomycetaceae bacterium]|nr:ABC transporter permease [Planctomycetaceae bacterium]
MWRPLFLAWNALKYYRTRSLLLMFCLAITFSLPLVSRMLIVDFESQLRSRADATPLVVGARGSRFDLALHVLYFKEPALPTIPYREYDRLSRTDLGTAFPLHRQLTVQGTPLVGTTSGYFPFRDLLIAEGRSIGRLGDCVVGAQVAKDWDVHPGDHLTVDATNVFSIAGIPPLRLNVSGVLKENQSADDDAVFVTVQTAWVATGIGHGHSGSPDTDHNVQGKNPEETQKTLGAAALLPYTEITDENIGQFHFHGEQLDFPITAVIFDPLGDRESTLLRGQYVSDEAEYQIVSPSQVVDELMEVVFQFRFFLDLAAVLMGITTGCLLLLIGWLTLQIRQAEIKTMVRIGSSRSMVFQLHAAELGLLLIGAGVVTGIVLLVIKFVGASLLVQFLV